MLRNADSGVFVPFPIPDEDWTYNTQINSSGQVQTGNSYKFSAITTFYPVSAGDQFVRTSENTDASGDQVYIWVHELKTRSTSSSQWIKRTFLLKGEEYTIGENCTYVRFASAYPAALSKTMTKAIIDEYFAVSKKEG